MTEIEIKNKLNDLSTLVNNMNLDNGTKEGLQSRISALLNSSGLSMEALSANLNDLKTSILASFTFDPYHDFIEKNYYALNLPIQYLNVYEDRIKSTDNQDEQLSFIGEYIREYKNAENFLKNNKFNDYTLLGNRGVKTLNESTKNASDALMRLDELEMQLRNSQNPIERDSIIKEIDSQLKILNSSKRKLNKLQEKGGHIEARQRSVKIKAELYTKNRNQSVLDANFNSQELSDKLNNLKNAYKKQALATNRDDILKAKTEIKAAERELYGRKLTKRRNDKINDALAERQQILNKAFAQEIDSNHAYRKEYKSAMKDLKRVDKKIIGRKNANELYNNLKQKAGYLMGGTSIVIPSQIVNLESSLSGITR